MRTRVLISLLFSAFAVLVAAQAATAAKAAPKAPSFALRPLKYDPALPATKSYFVLDTQPGATITDKIRVSNVGNRAGRLKLYAVDATTGQTSGTVYKNGTAPRRDAGAWIRLATR